MSDFDPVHQALMLIGQQAAEIERLNQRLKLLQDALKPTRSGYVVELDFDLADVNAALFREVES